MNLQDQITLSELILQRQLNVDDRIDPDNLTPIQRFEMTLNILNIMTDEEFLEEFLDKAPYLTRSGIIEWLQEINLDNLEEDDQDDISISMILNEIY